MDLFFSFSVYAIDYRGDRLRTANRTSSGGGKALALLENKATIQATRGVYYDRNLVSQRPFHVREMVVHFFFGNP